jgi:hypothetical protein
MLAAKKYDVPACVVPSTPILVTLMKVALSSSKTSVLTRATCRNIPEDAILHSHRRENLKSYLPEPDSSAVHPVASRYTNCATAALQIYRVPVNI